MYARAVRFTGVPPEAIQKVLAQIEESDGPPPGVAAKSMQMLYDAEQQTSLFVAWFENAEDMAAADQVFGAMDSAETPGTRASVDLCEVMAAEEVG
ncbi:MAG: hypothetical protein U0R52_02255 [Solirubrobacterales bacterium]